MIRVYQLADTHKEFVQDITYATNSQNPVDLRDLRSNDEMQKQLELGLSSLGYTYSNLLKDKGLALDRVSHRNIQGLLQVLEDKRDHYYADAIQVLENALKACYGDRAVSLQQLSATFRRGDLLEMLDASEKVENA